MKITERFRMAIGVFAIAVLGVGCTALVPAGNVSAVDPTDPPATANKTFTCPDGKQGSGADYAAACGVDGGGQQQTDLMPVLNTIINVIIGVIGFVAVVMIVVGGIQYTLSSGDSSKVTKAKNTIMYGIIGLVIALLAFAIVNFVLSNVFGGGGASANE